MEGLLFPPMQSGHLCSHHAIPDHIITIHLFGCDHEIDCHAGYVFLLFIFYKMGHVISLVLALLIGF